MKYILSIILFFLLAGSLSAQNEQDQVIFKAMQDEMQRSKEQLMLPGMQKPYYLSYTLGRTHQFEVVGALGVLLIFTNLLGVPLVGYRCFWEITIIIMILIMYVLLFRPECRNRLIMM